jgi:hypothetical protein
MHELLVNIDDTTYQRIIEDARMKGIEPRDWIRHAIDEFLAGRQSAIKEITPCENEGCTPGAVNMHAEVYSPRSDREHYDIIEQLHQRIRDLEAERDNLRVLLDQKTRSENMATGDEAELITLKCEIEKSGIELDEMETARERLRLEKDQLLIDSRDNHRIQQIEKEIETQDYEIENFKGEIAKIMSIRESLREELAKKKNETSSRFSGAR